MDLRWIDDFIVLARTRNFSRAAEECNITQSSFSRRIRALENWAGTLLVERSVPVTLTAEGRAFLEVVDPIVRQIHALRHTLQVKGRGRDKSVIFALPHTASMTVLPRLVRELEQDGLEGLYIRIITDDLEPLVARFVSGDCHFLGAYQHADIPKLPDLAGTDAVSLGQERLVPVSAPAANGRPRFALPGSRQVPLPALMIAETSLLGRALAHDLRSRFPTCWIRLAAENALALALKPLAEAGAGLAWLPQSLVEAELASGKLVRAGDDAWVVTLDLYLYRAVQLGSRVAEKVWSALSKRSKANAVKASSA